MPNRVFLEEDLPHRQGVLADLLPMIGEFEAVGTATTA